MQSARPSIFRDQASHAREGIALIFDITSFGAFFNQPDVHRCVPKYLNHVSKCLDVALFGGDTFWLDDEKQNLKPLSVLPIHRKFLGDGALYVWAPEDSSVLTESFVLTLCNRLWNLQKQFGKINRACADDVPVYELPLGIRFGLARGTVFELTVEDTSEKEYIGVCINLASRLQKYCQGINFLASGRLNLRAETLKSHNHVKVVATRIKGFPKEVVIADGTEYSRLEPSTRTALFMEPR